MFEKKIKYLADLYVHPEDYAPTPLDQQRFRMIIKTRIEKRITELLLPAESSSSSILDELFQNLFK